MAIDVKNLVAEELVKLAPSVSGSVVSTLALREHDRRVAAFLYVVEEMDKTQKEIYKIKPDHVGYDLDRKVVAESYTKETLDRKKKLEEYIEKLTKAIDATEKEPRDFSKVIEIAKL